MRPRFLSGLLAALALAACSDETPTLTGEDPFPPGGIAVTREIILPASEFFRTLGSFSGYTDASDAGFLVAANQYGGELNARALARFSGFPTTVTYTRNGASRTDALFTYQQSRLVLELDSAASAGHPFTVQVWEAAQSWDSESATWTVAMDTGGVQTPWAQPGGTLGPMLGQAQYGIAGGDSLVVTLPGAAVARLADSLSNGVIVTVAETGARVEFGRIQLRGVLRPDSAAPDTTLNFTATVTNAVTIYTPEQPDAPAGTIAVGGVRSARTLVELDLEQTVPGCAVGQTCAEVPITEVQLNQVAVLLRPAAVPRGFGAPNPVPLALRMVDEPELGRTAPLGQTFLDAQVVSFSSADSVAVLPVTNLTGLLARNDSFSHTFALVSEVLNVDGPPTFGALFFHPDARLRIVYTLPARRPLP